MNAWNPSSGMAAMIFSMFSRNLSYYDLFSFFGPNNASTCLTLLFVDEIN